MATSPRDLKEALLSAGPLGGGFIYAIQSINPLRGSGPSPRKAKGTRTRLQMDFFKSLGRSYVRGRPATKRSVLRQNCGFGFLDGFQDGLGVGGFAQAFFNELTFHDAGDAADEAHLGLRQVFRG